MALPSQRDMRDALAVYGYALLSARHTAKAHDVFRGMRALYPDDTYVAKCLAVTSLAMGDAAGALALADRTRPIAAGDDRLTLDFVRGKALFALGRPDEARASLGRVLAHYAATAATPAPTNGRTP
jgi:predicted Zn-dependent protease